VTQPDRTVERRGPAFRAAFDSEGLPTRAATGFAQSCGTTVDRLERMTTDKGEWLVYRGHETGQAAAALLPAIARQALDRLPIPKRMRWGDSDAEFVRPVHWLAFLHGEDVVDCTLLDAPAGRETRGHRFHHPEALIIERPDDYERLLWAEGYVIPDFDARRDLIRIMVERAAAEVGGTAVVADDLLDEVTALVEWPAPVTGSFETGFLGVPQEALIATMQSNQKYFPLVDSDGRLMAKFITVANIATPDPAIVREGNERVIRPRFSDAMFFWQQDGKKRLEDHVDSLRHVVFQKQLGSLHDKSERVASLAEHIAGQLGGDPALARRAGMLSRCDLQTAMVYEFPEMQGIMGRYQAQRDGEPEALAVAMEEFYLPRFSGDDLPGTTTGIAISLAERLDTLTGIFGIGQKPTGEKDPFALRRAALGILRILVEKALPLDLRALLELARQGLGGRITNDVVVEEVFDFMLERLKGYYHEAGYSPDLFEAVAAVKPTSPSDFDRRLQAVAAFRTLAEAESLAAANKRIRNILRKADEPVVENITTDLLEQAAEEGLYHRIAEMEQLVAPLLNHGDYTGILRLLAGLRETVDTFFDDVMVMAEDERLRRNRLALLKRLQALFLQVADVGHLQS
jgi:glycyl-tRNA synthetase beta chain